MADEPIDDKTPKATPAKLRDVLIRQHTFLSPYKMFPDVDAARDALAVREAEREDEVTPQAATFDPTKPTIDQTRANAIHSIQQNFEALIPVSVPVDHSQYLKKSYDTAVNITINPGPLYLVAPANGWSMIRWYQGDKARWDTFCDYGGYYYTAYDDNGANGFNVLVLGRNNHTMSLMGRMGVGGGPRALPWGSPNLDIYNTGNAILCLQSIDTTAGMKLTAVAGVAYIDTMYAYNDGTLAAGYIPLMLRTQDASGVYKNRLSINGDGAIRAEEGSFVGKYLSAPGASPFTLDFRVAQTYYIPAGSVVSGVIMSAGQVARIYVYPGGPVTLPGNWFLQTGGAVWGSSMTFVTLWTEGSNIFATFTPFGG